jgi:uncharacterized protein (TIGR02594 family)
MKLVTIQGTRVFDKPDGERIALLAINATVEGTGTTEGLFVEIKHQDKTAWIRQENVKPADNSFRLPLDEAFFVEECNKVAREINALTGTPPWLVSPDFLVARALIETGMTNAGSKLPDCVGPLQVSSAEWKDFLENGDGRLKAGLDADDRDGWLLQVVGAGWRMREQAKALSSLQPAAAVGQDGDQDRFLPSYLDVFHAHILDSPDAAMAVRDAIVAADAKKGDEAKAAKAVPITQVLQPKLDAAKLADLFARRQPFLGAQNAPKTLGEFVANTEATLDAALKTAFDKTKELVPEELPKIAQGEAPWFDVAQDELKKDVAENNAQSGQIVSYFKATNFGNGATPATPWCGAFAAFCVQQAGLKPPAGAAVAANWKNWGSELPFRSGEIPQGAVVVLSPSEGTGTSGHVGFFNGFAENGKRVQLLGGNQSDALNVKSFLTSRIAAVRWIDLQPKAPPDDAPSSTPTPSSSTPTPSSSTPISSSRTPIPSEGSPSGLLISKAAIDLIVEAEVTGKALYEKRYRRPIWPKGMSGVTVGIGYDVGHQSKAQVAQDWTGVIGANMVALLQSACGVTGAAAAPLAKKLADVDISFDQAMQVFLKRDVPRWVGTVRKALPNIDDPNVTANRLGALVSLAYNRGASFAKAGSRYAEMNNIRKHMTGRKFDLIPAEFRSMKRLWPDMAGLLRRRDAEAKLFETG